MRNSCTYSIFMWRECPEITCKESKPMDKNHSFNLCCPTPVSKIACEPPCFTYVLKVISATICAAKFHSTHFISWFVHVPVMKWLKVVWSWRVGGGLKKAVRESSPIPLACKRADIHEMHSNSGIESKPPVKRCMPHLTKLLIHELWKFKFWIPTFHPIKAMNDILFCQSHENFLVKIKNISYTVKIGFTYISTGKAIIFLVLRTHI